MHTNQQRDIAISAQTKKRLHLPQEIISRFRAKADFVRYFTDNCKFIQTHPPFVYVALKDLNKQKN